MKVNHCEYRVLTIELSILSAPLVHRKLINFSVAPRPQGQVHNKIDPLGPADAPGLPDTRRCHFSYSRTIFRAATGVLSNIDHQKKPEYWPNIDHTALYWPNIDRKSSLKSAHLHQKNNMMCHILRFICMFLKGCHPVWFVVICCFLIGTKANNCTYAKGITAVTILGFWWNIDHFDVISTTNLRILTI